MNRITTRLVVATTVMVSFVITALSGLILYVPVQLLPVFGLSLLTWRAIHEWAAVVLTAAVIVHLVLHRRRIGQMIAGLARPAPSPRAEAAPAVGQAGGLRGCSRAGVRRPGASPSARHAPALPHRLRGAACRVCRRLRRRRGFPPRRRRRPAHGRERWGPRPGVVPRAERRAGAARAPGAVGGDRRRARGQAPAAGPRRLVRAVAPHRDG